MMRPSSLSLPALISPRTSRVVPNVIPPKKWPPDGPAPRGDPSCRIGTRLLGLAAPIGLSLMVTAGFAAALGLCTNLTLSSPQAIDSSAAVFLWSLVPFSCVTHSWS
jgi:hypothetical protein